jgi:hypothetical protein
MKNHKVLFLALLSFGQLSFAGPVEIGKKANDDMAAAMSTVVNGASSILACSIIGKGVKNSFTSLKDISDQTAEPFINYACAGLYASFVAARAFMSGENDQEVKSGQRTR